MNHIFQSKDYHADLRSWTIVTRTAWEGVICHCFRIPVHLLRSEKSSCAYICELEIGKKPIMWSTGTHTSTSRMIIVRSAMKGVITIDEHCWQTLWQESVCQQWAGKSDNSKRKLTKCWVVQFESEQFFGGWVLTKYVGPTYLTASNNQQIRKIRKQN